MTLVVSAACSAALPAAQLQPDIGVALVARAMQPGEVVRVDVTCACGQTPPQVSAFGIDVPMTLSPDGARWQGLVGLDLDVASGVYPLVVSMSHQQSPLTRETPLRVQPKQFRTRTLRVSPQFVEPSPELVTRALDEAALLERIFKTVTRRAWDRSFGLPLHSQPTENFGARSVFNGQPRSPHAGVDFSSPAGTPVTAPAAGTVVLASDLFFTGNTVVIDHGAGVFSLLAHLSLVTVAAGDVVDFGASVGRVGATGRATGPHLHWSVRLNGMRVDPLSLIMATDDRGIPRQTR